MGLRQYASASFAALMWISSAALADTTLLVMTFNVYGGGANDGKPVDETVAAIKAAGADIIGIQETRLESDPCDADNCPPTGESVAKAIADKLGFVDAYRVAHPDEVAKSAYTWTPTSEPSDPEDHHDRIDFVLARAKDLKVENASIVGEKPETAEIVVTASPSDHRAVVAKVRF